MIPETWDIPQQNRDIITTNADTHSELTTCQAPVSFTWINSTLKQLIYYIKDKEAETPRCEVISSRLIKSTQWGDFSGSPGIKTPPSQCRGPRLNPWSGKIPHATWRGQKKKKVHGGPRPDPRRLLTARRHHLSWDGCTLPLGCLCTQQQTPGLLSPGLCSLQLMTKLRLTESLPGCCGPGPCLRVESWEE